MPLHLPGLLRLCLRGRWVFSVRSDAKSEPRSEAPVYIRRHTDDDVKRGRRALGLTADAFDGSLATRKRKSEMNHRGTERTESFPEADAFDPVYEPRGMLRIFTTD